MGLTSRARVHPKESAGEFFSIGELQALSGYYEMEIDKAGSLPLGQADGDETFPTNLLSSLWSAVA